MDSKETEKIEKYQDLAWELKNPWTWLELIPVVTVGTPARKLKRQLEIIGIHTKFCRPPEQFPLTASVCHLSNIIIESSHIEVSIWSKKLLLLVAEVGGYI